MPLEMPEDDEDDVPRRRRRFDTPSAPWWRPAGTFGRILLGTGAVITVSAIVTGYVLAARALERDARFRIAGTGDIQAAGLSQVSRADVLPVFGEDIGKNIFFVHLNERRKQLEQIPWVEHATVMRLLPDQIRVSLVERTPIAFVRQGQQIGLIDANGVLLSMSPTSMTQHHYSFPVVTGIDAAQPLSSRRARMAVYQRLIGDLDSTGQHLSEQISEIDLTDPEDARVLMPEQGADILAHFGDDQFLARYRTYKAHIAEWRQQYPNLVAVDLRYDHQVVLERGQGAEKTAVDPGNGNPLNESKTAEKNPSKPSPASKAAAERPATKAPVRSEHKAVHAKPKPKAHATATHPAKKHPEPKHTVATHTKSTNHAATMRQGQ